MKTIKKIIRSLLSTLQVIFVLSALPFYLVAGAVIIVVSIPLAINDKIIKVISDKKTSDVNEDVKVTQYKSKMSKHRVFESISDIIDKSEKCNDC